MTSLLAVESCLRFNTRYASIRPKRKANYALFKRDPRGVYQDRPLPPPGLKEERRANLAGVTHQFYKVPSDGLPPRGLVAAKLPQKVHLEAGKEYKWCTCGLSKNQPFCDGKHLFKDKDNFYKGAHYLYRPLKFTVNETKDYFLCQCKKTEKRPFCDGTHRTLWHPNDAYVIRE